MPGQLSYPYPGDVGRSPCNPLYPAPGLYAISATNLQGLWLAGGDVFVHFRSQEPVAQIGHSILVYEVPATATGQANPTCISGLDLGDLDTESIGRSFGRGLGWIKWFDHHASFILPGSGDAVYVLPSPPLEFASDWQDVFHSRAVVLHTQSEIDEQPAATVYVLDRAAVEAIMEDVLASLEEPMPLVAVPAVFDHSLEFLGYRLLSPEGVSPGQDLELGTVWRVTAEMPPAMGDLQMFVHLLDAEGQWRGGQDRLDLEPLAWEAGDVLLQYHRLNVPGDAVAGKYQVTLGLYVRHTMERLSIYDNAGQSVGDRLLLRWIDVDTP